MKQTDSKGIQFVAFHYPPIVGSSGVYRTLSFTRHFDAQGWDVNVITASLSAYENWSEKQYQLIPKNVTVHRAFCLDTTKHLSFKGKYLSFMSIPDNWQSWAIGGLFTGLIQGLLKRPKVVFSTYPIATAHLIGYCLHKLLNVPWVADLRDPMAQQGYPANESKRKVWQWLEGKIVKHCSFAIVTAPSAKDLYLNRFPKTNSDFWKVLPNGYDDVTFDPIIDKHKSSTCEESRHKVDANKKMVVLHSGIIYPGERDPSFLFAAVAKLKEAGAISERNLEIRLRATGHDDLYLEMINELDIADIVTLKPTVSYAEAIEEMLTVDGLLLMQSDGCNFQIPAKSYEYIKIQKPILGLMPIEGDTGQLINKLNISQIAPLDDKEKIEEAITLFLGRLKEGGFSFPEDDIVEQFSRSHQAVELERLISEIVK